MKGSYLWLIVRLLLTLFIILGLTAAVLNSTPPSIYGLTIFIFIFLVSAFFSFRLTFKRELFVRLLEAEVSENRLEAFHLLIAPFAFIGTFSLICYNIYELFPGSFISLVEEPSRESWMTFMLDQTARAILLDVFETYKIKVSNIDYRSPDIATLILLYKAMLAIFFWKFILNFFLGWKPTIKTLKQKAT
jgi:hypothetical protein